MLVLNLPFKALMFLTLMRPSLVLFLVLWLKLVKDFLKVRCRLALLPFLIRSEERRVGKEGRSRGAAYDLKKNVAGVSQHFKSTKHKRMGLLTRRSGTEES